MGFSQSKLVWMKFFPVACLVPHLTQLLTNPGSGIGALRDILMANPFAFEDEAPSSTRPLVGGNGSASYRAAAIYARVRCARTLS